MGKPTTRNDAAVDEAFRRMFHYEWGTTTLDIMDVKNEEWIRIFGSARAARILGSITTSTTTRRKRKAMSTSTTPISSSSLSMQKRIQLFPPSTNALPVPVPPTATAAAAAAVAVVQPNSATSTTSTPTSMNATLPKPALAKTTKMDTLLAQLAGPAKSTTIQKTSDDWESFKERNEVMQDELEKQAQGNNAYLVKKDFLNRVDQRKFEMERAERERERTKKMG